MIGAYALDQWKLPVSIIDALRMHHNSPLDVADKLGRTVIAGEALARVAFEDPPFAHEPAVDPEAALHALGLQAVSIDGYLYTSGQIALDPQTGNLVHGGFEAQARQVLANLQAVLASAGCTFGDVVKATVYVVDLADFPTLNTIYGEAMGNHRPARSTVQVSALPKGAQVEIDLVAKLP